MKLTNRIIAIMLSCMALSLQAGAQTVAGDDTPLQFGRFEYQGKAYYGFLAVGGIHELTGSFFDAATKTTGRVIPLEEAKILAPVIPTKVIGIALNYPSHGGTKTPDLAFFAKLPSAVIGPEEKIIPPPGSSNLHYEGELVIVMGARARNVSEDEALDYVYGVTAGNDVTERGYGFSPFVVLKAKGADTLSPLGPWIVPGLDYDKLELRTRVNGKIVQKTSTSKMIASCAKIISQLSRYMTLEPGDLIYTGTPGKTGALKPGDVVEIDIEGIGILRNTVGQPADD